MMSAVKSHLMGELKLKRNKLDAEAMRLLLAGQHLKSYKISIRSAAYDKKIIALFSNGECY